MSRVYLNPVLRWAAVTWLYSLLLLQACQRIWPQIWLEPIWVWSFVYAWIPAACGAGLSWGFSRYWRVTEAPIWQTLLLFNGLALFVISWITLGPPVQH